MKEGHRVQETHWPTVDYQQAIHAMRHKALDMAVQCRPFDGECLESLYEAILAKLEEIDALKTA